LEVDDVLWLDLTLEDLTAQTEFRIEYLGVDHDVIEEAGNEYHEVIIFNSRFINMSLEEFNMTLLNNIYVKGVSSGSKYSKVIIILKIFSKIS
jgi:hypothetical protein